MFENLISKLLIIAHIEPESHLGEFVHFFLHDGIKIFAILYLVVFFISLFRKRLSAEKIKLYLHGKNRFIAYFLAVFIGAFIPFCSCSAIPLFLGFVAVGIPFGCTMAFLLSSALINEVAVFLLIGISGMTIAGIYVFTGTIIAIIGGFICDQLKFERFLSKRAVTGEPSGHDEKCHREHGSCCCCEKQGLISYAHYFSLNTIKETWVYILIGLFVGAFLHGYVPEEFIARNVGVDNLFAVPIASIIGSLIYAPHGAAVPMFNALLQKGVPLGTSLVVFMSITAISFPEIAMLKKALSVKLLLIFLMYIFISLNAIGYLLNLF